MKNLKNISNKSKFPSIQTLSAEVNYFTMNLML